MEKEKLIKFLAFIGIESDELTERIMDSKIEVTDVILILTAKKTGEDLETIKRWYNQYKPCDNYTIVDATNDIDIM